MRHPAPTVCSVHETVLYAIDVLAAAEFYQTVLGMRLLANPDQNSAALRLPEGDAVLLLFNPTYAATQGRGVPTHGATGAGHVALRVEPGSLPNWAHHVRSHGVPVELERTWQRGGASLYFRDPSNNSVELVDGQIWPE